MFQILNLTDAELSAIYSCTETLLGEESQTKHEIVAGILSEKGEYQGILCRLIVLLPTLPRSYSLDSRLLEITHTYLTPPPDAQPEPSTPEDYTPVDEPEASPVVASAPPVGISSGGGLLFMQESELDPEGKVVEDEHFDQAPLQESEVEQEPEPEQVTVIAEEEVVIDGNVVEESIVVSIILSSRLTIFPDVHLIDCPLGTN